MKDSLEDIIRLFWSGDLIADMANFERVERYCLDPETSSEDAFTARMIAMRAVKTSE